MLYRGCEAERRGTAVMPGVGGVRFYELRLYSGNETGTAPLCMALNEVARERFS